MRFYALQPNFQTICFTVFPDFWTGMFCARSALVSIVSIYCVPLGAVVSLRKSKISLDSWCEIPRNGSLVKQERIYRY